MNIKKLLIVSVLAVAFLGCGKREARHIIILPDVSGSIERKSIEQAFEAINKLAGKLHRGDKLTIIPIFGDAQAEASGNIVRFEVPSDRQAYDTDLRDFRTKLHMSLKAMQTKAISHPGSRTDILGAVGLAEHEFQFGENSPEKLLIVMSDFIEDDGILDFTKDGRFSNQQAASQLAEEMTSSKKTFPHVRVYLELLRSSEYAALAKNRRAAIETFWTSYFVSLGSQPKFAPDGVGSLGLLKFK